MIPKIKHLICECGKEATLKSFDTWECSCGKIIVLSEKT